MLGAEARRVSETVASTTLFQLAMTDRQTRLVRWVVPCFESKPLFDSMNVFI